MSTLKSCASHNHVVHAATDAACLGDLSVGPHLRPVEVSVTHALSSCQVPLVASPFVGVSSSAKPLTSPTVGRNTEQALLFVATFGRVVISVCTARNAHHAPAQALSVAQAKACASIQISGDVGMLAEAHLDKTTCAGCSLQLHADSGVWRRSEGRPCEYGKRVVLKAERRRGRELVKRMAGSA